MTLLKRKPADYLFWAVKQQTGNTTRNLILVYLADFMGKDGCFPSHNTLAKRCSCKRNAIIRHLNTLEEDGWISVERRASKGMKESNLYSLNLAKSDVSLEDKGSILGIQPMYSTDTGGSISEIHKTPIIKHPIKHPIKPTPSVITPFDEFYAAYPKKAGRAKAKSAWDKLKPQDALIDRIIRDVHERVTVGHWDVDKGKQYIPHPSTYLNGYRWEDAVEPKAGYQSPEEFAQLCADTQDLTESFK
tara:strand:+ start:900 stop:1637 length:738 start_codon:yes stop_codon:yes gene_type:complete